MAARQTTSWSRTCTKCDLVFETRGPRAYRCPPCQKAARNAASIPRTQKSVKSKRRFLASVKLTAGCQDCGYNDHSEALHFDHRPDETKLFNIALCNRAWDTLLVEVEKCDVVCANHHAVRTADRRKGVVPNGR